MPTARLPIDAAHRAASSDAHAISAVTGLQAALDGRLPAVPSTVVLFGTSLESQNGSGPSTLDPVSSEQACSSRGWFNWANGYLGQRFNLLNNAGVGGNRYEQMLARIQADVIDYDPGWVFIGGAANDIIAGYTAEKIEADLVAILDAIGSTRRVLLLNTAPSTSFDTAPKQVALHALNRYIAELPLTRRNVVVVDCWKLLADPATGYPAAGMTVDGLHYTETAACRIGQSVAAALDPIVPQRPQRWSGLTDPDNILVNPALTSGTGWGVSAVGGESVAYIADTETWATKAVLTLTGIADGAERYITQAALTSAGLYSAGDIVQMEARIKWESIVPVGGATYKWCRPFGKLFMRNIDSTWQGMPAYFMIVASSLTQAVVGFPASGDMVLRTPRITITENVNRLYVYLGWAGAASGVVTISDVSCWKNAT